jgi:hypothetical protein
VSRPMLVVVLNDCVTETKDAAWASKISISLAKSASERVSRSLDHDYIDSAGPHPGEQRLQGQTVERGSGQAAIIIMLGHQPPALTGLAADIGLAGFSKFVEARLWLALLPGLEHDRVLPGGMRVVHAHHRVEHLRERPRLVAVPDAVLLFAMGWTHA